MTMPFTHKKDEVRATGTLEARTPGDQASSCRPEYPESRTTGERYTS